MSPVSSRFRIRARYSVAYVAEIDAPDRQSAEAIARYLLKEELWSRAFFKETESFEILGVDPLNREGGR
jgi:hypothetical protein